MGKKAARQKDQLDGFGIHTLKPFIPQLPPFPMFYTFKGEIKEMVSFNVRIQGKPAAMVFTVAVNKPKHKPLPGTKFLVPPTNRGFIAFGSKKVKINKRAAAREGDKGFTDSEIPLPIATVKIKGSRTVRIG